MRMDELLGEIPQQMLTEALDDDADGIADESAWAAVQASAEERIRTAFGGDVPATHIAAAAYARKLFILVVLYNRRGLTAEANPYTSAANRAEERLYKLASGEASTDGGSTEPTFIGEPAKIAGTSGLMA